MTDDFEKPYNDLEEYETVDGGLREEYGRTKILYFQNQNASTLCPSLPCITLPFFVSMMLVIKKEPQTPLETFGIFSLNVKIISKRLRLMVVLSAARLVIFEKLPTKR